MAEAGSHLEHIVADTAAANTEIEYTELVDSVEAVDIDLTAHNLADHWEFLQVDSHIHHRNAYQVRSGDHNLHTARIQERRRLEALCAGSDHN